MTAAQRRMVQDAAAEVMALIETSDPAFAARVEQGVTSADPAVAEQWSERVSRLVVLAVNRKFGLAAYVAAGER